MPAGWLGSAKALHSSGSALAPGAFVQGSRIKSLPSLHRTLSSLAGTVLENTHSNVAFKKSPVTSPKDDCAVQFKGAGLQEKLLEGPPSLSSPPAIPFFSFHEPIPFFFLLPIPAVFGKTLPIHEPIPFFFLFPIPAVFGKTCKQLTF